VGWLLLLAALLALASCRPAAPRHGIAGARPNANPPISTAGPTPAVAGRAPTASLITHGPRDRPEVALTFDADMTPGVYRALQTGRTRIWYDASIVEQLRATHTPATIFLTALWARSYPEVVRSLAADPLFEIANHSVDHAAWRLPCFRLAPVASPAAKRAEVGDAASEIQAVSGVSPRYFRFPGGCHGPDDLRLVASEGEQPVGWDVISGDAFQPDPGVVVRNVLRDTKPGSIVIMHLMGPPNAPATSRALAQILPGLRQRGLQPVTLSTLLADSPAGSPPSAAAPTTFAHPALG
jgi:peptidoglycan/xylan/chitin deacetylase (PgdA/CDA1 family)